MSRYHHLKTILAAAAVMPLAISCSGDSQGDTIAAEDAGAAASEECGGLLGRADVAEAFNGLLTVKDTTVAAMGDEVAGCMLFLDEGANNRINFNIGDAEDFASRKDSQMRQTGGTHEAFDAGAEAFDAGAEAHVFNGINVIALNAEGKSLSLGLSSAAIKEENLLTHEQSTAGLKLLAQRIMSRL